MPNLSFHVSRKKIYKLKKPHLDFGANDKVEDFTLFNGFWYSRPALNFYKEKGNYIYSLKFKKYKKSLKIKTMKDWEHLENHTYSYFYKNYDNIEIYENGKIYGVLFNTSIVKEFKLYAKAEKYNTKSSNFILV